MTAILYSIMDGDEVADEIIEFLPEFSVPLLVLHDHVGLGDVSCSFVDLVPFN